VKKNIRGRVVRISAGEYGEKERHHTGNPGIVRIGLAILSLVQTAFDDRSAFILFHRRRQRHLKICDIKELPWEG
jgi:hypothetical protein